MKSPFVKIIFRILVFVAVIAIMDMLAGAALRYLYYHQHKGLYHRTTFAMDRTKAELLVFGSSAANHHYVPEIYDSILGLSFYNAGRDGMEMLYDLAVLKGVLSRYTPSVIILNLTPSELSNVDGYDRLSSLLPYYRNHPEIRSIVHLRSRFEHLKMISSVYPYNSTVLTVIKGNLESIPGKKEESGYLPLFTSMQKPIGEPATFKEEPALDTNRINALKEFIQLCQKRDIHLYLVNSPWYYAKLKTTATLEKTREICEDYGIPYFNYTFSDFFAGRNDLFMDEGHLNDRGARIFSRMIATRIKQDLLAADTLRQNIVQP